jgi:hypothetical protein
MVLAAFPEKIQLALRTYTLEINFLIEAVVEMVFASFLDDKALSFEDCLLAERLRGAA